jgi:hypothetical protein
MPLGEAVLGALGGLLTPLCASALGAEGRTDAPLGGAMLELEGLLGASEGPATGAKLTPLLRANSRSNDSPAACALARDAAAGGGMAGAPVRCTGGGMLSDS